MHAREWVWYAGLQPALNLKSKTKLGYMAHTTTITPQLSCGMKMGRQVGIVDTIQPCDRPFSLLLLFGIYLQLKQSKHNITEGG